MPCIPALRVHAPYAAVAHFHGNVEVWRDSNWVIWGENTNLCYLEQSEFHQWCTKARTYSLWWTNESAERLFRHKVITLLREEGLSSEKRIELLLSRHHTGLCVRGR